VSLGVAERFMSLVLKNEELETKPIFEDDGVNYISIKHNDLYILAVTKKNADAAMILLFLYTLVKVLIDYFQTLEEESIRDNFVIIYELLDEIMDFGYPQSTEEKILKEYITQEGYRFDSGPAPKPPVALTNAVSWRSEGIVHRKNEIFLDVIERLTLLVSSTGQVLRSEIHGSLLMKSYLSGMPDLRLGLNDKLMLNATGKNPGKGKAVEMEDVKFHQCVRLSRFEHDRTISFIPPDGAFELMSYRLNTTVKPLIWAEVTIESQTRSKLEFLVKVRSQFKSRSTANNVEIVIPVPDDVDTPSFKASVGSVTYVPDKDCIIWTIKSFYGGREHTLKAHFGLPSTSKSGESDSWKRPIEVRFEIPYFTVSSLSIRYLRIVEKSGYQALPWVRYISMSGPGDYLLRMKG